MGVFYGLQCILAPNGARPVHRLVPALALWPLATLGPWPCGPGRTPGPAGPGAACGRRPVATPHLALHCKFSVVDFHIFTKNVIHCISNGEYHMTTF